MRVGIFFSRVCIFSVCSFFTFFPMHGFLYVPPHALIHAELSPPRNDGSLRDAPVHAKKGLL